MTGRAEAASLAPVRARMLREARMEADRIVEQAHAEATAIVSQARSSAEEAVALAWARGRADGAQAAAAERSRGREQARSILFGAQRETHEELRGRVLAAVDGLRDEPGYEGLLSRLTAMAAGAAGPDATITVQPTGGVVARSRGVVVDCTLPKLASLAVDALGSEVRELWTP
jgi:vacuolar-type H+-ATPase subunit E/Vma4